MVEPRLRFTVEKEDLALPTNVSVGYRVYFWTTGDDVGKYEIVRIYSGSKSWKIRVVIVADANAAHVAAKKAGKEGQGGKSGG